MRMGQILKHEDNTDAAIEVLKIQYRDDRRVKVRVSWVNVTNPERWFPMGVVETIEIQRKDLPKWKEIKL